MEVQISWLGVLLATLSSMVVGSVWYMPKLFGSSWMKHIGKNEKELAKNGMKPIAFALVAGFVTAYILAHFTYMAYTFYIADYSYLSAALITAFWAWLGFIVVRVLMHDSFEGRPRQLTAINAAHELTTLLAMGLIIGLVGIG